MNDPDLTERCILLVEDDHVIARSLARLLTLWGAIIAGPAATAEQALALLENTDRLDFAVVDINLRGAMAFAVADALIARGVPFAFTTGYDASAIPERYRHAAVLQKPYDPVDIWKALFRLTTERSHPRVS